MSSVKNIGRRQFLVGSGGFLLALPFLGSLWPRRSSAQATSQQKRFIALLTDHGGVHHANFFPADPSELTSRELYASTGSLEAHDIHFGPLSATIDGSRAILSNTLQASASVLTPSLLGKLNVIAGTDITTYLGHTRGGPLGNYAANDQNPGLHGRHMATIDQLIAASESFNQVAPKERSLNFARGYGADSSMSFSASVQVQSGVPSAVQAASDPGVVWQRVFGDVAPDPEAPRPLIVDRVYEHYRSLTTGAFGDAARLSSRDRQRLEAHMERLLELDRKLSVTLSCSRGDEPQNPMNDMLALEIAVDVIATALMCGASNVAVISAATEGFTDEAGWTNWHEQVAHGGGGTRNATHNPESQAMLYRTQRSFFERVFLRLCTNLEAEESDGATFLDNSLVVWTCESGIVTHDNLCIPVVTAGSAAGFFETGRLIDLRNRANTRWSIPDMPEMRPGVLYNQLLANFMQGMGLAPEEYHSELLRVDTDAFNGGARGYGIREYHPDGFWRGVNLQNIWPERLYQDGDELLPGLVKGV